MKTVYQFLSFKINQKFCYLLRSPDIKANWAGYIIRNFGWTDEGEKVQEYFVKH